jgi:hypothetical protein
VTVGPFPPPVVPSWPRILTAAKPMGQVSYAYAEDTTNAHKMTAAQTPYTESLIKILQSKFIKLVKL